MLGSCLSLVQCGIPFVPSILGLSFFRYPSQLSGPMLMPVLPSIITAIAPPRRRGTWLAMNSTMQAGVRGLMPLGLGFAYDANKVIPFLITGGVSLPLLLIFGLIHYKLGGNEKQAGQFDHVALEDEFEQTKIFSQLCDEYEHLHGLLEGHRTGTQHLEEVTSPRYTQHDAQALGIWLAEALTVRGYGRWAEPKILPMTKARLLNALPPVRGGSRVQKIEDLLKVYQTHIELNQKWTSVFDNDEFCAEIGKLCK